MMSGRGSSLSEPWKAMVEWRRQSSTIRCRAPFTERRAMLTQAALLRDAVQPQPLRAADGERQGVGGVARPAVAARGEQQAHHAGDLVLVGAAVAGDRRLDLRGAELPHLDAAAGEDREQGAARLGEDDERARVHAVKRGLDNGEIGPPAGDQLLQAAGEMGEPPRQVEIARAGEAAGVEGLQARAVPLDEAVAGMEAARVESQGK